ncbi:MAG TPA: hypothetical protein RMF84_19040 [Polyangiaceae bacterium LLY-WYZ-14_1]|nr:hypothetical protein [Polyangiaceae bacterium LLY-WYZ-14_1]
MSLRQEGIAWPEGRRSPPFVIPWEAVLVAIAFADEAVLVVSESPRGGPILRLPEALLPAEAPTPESFVALVRGRQAQTGGYRDAVPGRSVREAEHLRDRALARELIPGAVAIGPGPGIAGRGLLRRVSRAVAPGALAGAIGGGALAAFLAAPSVLLWGVAGALAGGVAEGVRRSQQAPPRVLLLAPAGFVAGLPDGVSAHRWVDVGGIRVAEGVTSGAPAALVLEAADGDRVLGVVGEEWLSEPVELVAAIARAYRDRALGR